MILKQLNIYNIGPFSDAKLIIEHDFTVITGSNDVGKSILLELISSLYEKSYILDQNRVNVDWFNRSNKRWIDDDDIRCDALFYIKDINKCKTYFNIKDIKDLKGDVQIRITFLPAPGLRIKRISSIYVDEKIYNFDINISSMPRLVNLFPDTFIRSEISIRDLNKSENNLLTLLFGVNPVAKMIEYNISNLRREIKRANKKMNDLIDRIFGGLLDVEVSLEAVDINRFVEDRGELKFIVSVNDKNGSETLINSRGFGVNKVLNMIFHLLINLRDDDYYIIVCDEPENGLHADYQHEIRAIVENLSLNDNIQIIYSTHSPSMINNVKNKNIRVIEKAIIDGESSSRINNSIHSEGYKKVRSVLGITPSDSLIYSEVSVIVEGLTEIEVLPVVIEKILKNDKERFNNIMNNICLINGQGHSIDIWCRLVGYQGGNPVIFADGEHAKRLTSGSISEKIENVPKIFFEKSKEIEDTVPHEVYVKAISNISGFELNINDYQEWINVNGGLSAFLFSKKIQMWLEDKYPDVKYYKSTVMVEAINICNIEDIDTVKYMELIDEIEKIINKKPLGLKTLLL